MKLAQVMPHRYIKKNDDLAGFHRTPNAEDAIRTAVVEHIDKSQLE